MPNSMPASRNQATLDQCEPHACNFRPLHELLPTDLFEPRQKRRIKDGLIKCDEMSLRSLLFIRFPVGPLEVEADLTNFSCA